MTICALIIAFILAFVGVPLAVCFGFASFFVIYIFGLVPLAVIPQMLWAGSENYVLVAIPFFIFAGVLAESGGIARRLIDFCNSIVGWFKGGLGATNIVASFFFGGISGSSLSDTASIGSIMIPEMEKNGYGREYSAAITAISSTLAVIVPPSILMVVVGVTAEVSIGRLLIGGIIPGVIMTATMLIQNYYISKKRNYGSYCKFSIKNVKDTFKKTFPAFGMPVIIILGIMTGVITPEESAVVVVYYIIFLGIYYKTMSLKKILNCIITTVKFTSAILFLVAASRLFTFIMTYEQIPQRIGFALMEVTKNPILLLLLIDFILLIAGMFMDAVVSILIFAPIFFPVITQVGINPIHFGVLFVLNLSIGLVTPPFGVCLFNVCNVAHIKFEALVKESLPLYLSLLAALLIVTFLPYTVTVLPNLFMK